MKLIGDLRKQVENEGTREGRKRLIEKAGMKLTDEELDMVAGGREERLQHGITTLEDATIGPDTGGDDSAAVY